MTSIRAGRRDVEISRPDKELFPGIAKLDLAGYYALIADTMLPLVANRPLNLERYPDGIGGNKIFQQHASKHFPDWVKRVETPKSGGTVQHVVANDAATLVYLANQGVITLHAWLSRRDRLDRPDRLIVDLDPSVEDHAAMRRAAIAVADLFEELGLRPWAMTSGSRGFHIVLSLARRAEYPTMREFARDFATLAERRHRELFTTEQRKAKREGKILLDVGRNNFGTTSVAPYSVRARPNAPVATPLELAELSDSATLPGRWTIKTIPERLDKDGNPWRDIGKHAESLGAAREKLDAALSET
ncbi:MAG TPA: non-homologous end-joining DNA ligase [Solirubrobacteraceae bacterium]|nr:non-homologous end-joining DNA ligase [Solirubrobacteraceae bacterium]